jgi:hypothetical protein
MGSRGMEQAGRRKYKATAGLMGKKAIRGF